MAIASLSISDIYGTLIDKNVPIRLYELGQKGQVVKEGIASIYFDDNEWVVRAIVIDESGKTEIEENLDEFDFDRFKEPHKKEIFDKICLMAVDKVWKDREEDIIEELMNNEDKSNFDNKDMAEILDNISSNNWQYYNDRGYAARNGYYVRNIKGKGFPDYDKVIKAVSEKTKKTTEEIEEEVTKEHFDNLFWDEVNREVEENDIKVVGRSGGYWGIEFNSDLIEIDSHKYKEETTKIFYRYRNSLDIDQNDSEDNIEDKIYNLIRDKFDNALSLYKPSKEAEEQITAMDKLITGIINEFEKPDMWVNTIISTYFE